VWAGRSRWQEILFSFSTSCVTAWRSCCASWGLTSSRASTRATIQIASMWPINGGGWTPSGCAMLQTRAVGLERGTRWKDDEIGEPWPDQAWRQEAARPLWVAEGRAEVRACPAWTRKEAAKKGMRVSSPRWRPQIEARREVDLLSGSLLEVLWASAAVRVGASGSNGIGRRCCKLLAKRSTVRFRTQQPVPRRRASATPCSPLSSTGCDGRGNYGQASPYCEGGADDWRTLWRPPTLTSRPESDEKQ